MRKETDNHPFKPFVKAIQDAIDEAATAFSHVEAAAAEAQGSSGCGHRARARRHHHRSSGEESEARDGHGFGVRRPLRLLARRLELSEEQVIEMSSILDEIRHARAQVSLDTQRTVGGFADTLLQGDLDGEKIRQLAAERVKSQEKMAAATVQCLERTHVLLDDEQRKSLAMLMRSGAITL
ncbi:MAG: hypothetical protein GY822_04840 [Deltaproteobacteria bacterium]|nr:hypothetical protein [Deltaproteobacteria bacterium]